MTNESIHYETKKMWWMVEPEQHGDHTAAIVAGQPHAVAQTVVPGTKIDHGPHKKFTANGIDREGVLTLVQQKIKELDGPIREANSAD